MAVKTEVAELQKSEKKQIEEIKVLRTNLEHKIETLEKADDNIKLKSEEIKRLTLTRKISVENGVRVQEKTKHLEHEMKQLKETKIISSFKTKLDLPYPCDKCERTFQTAAILVKHVKNEHASI